MTINIEEIADKYCTFDNDELRKSAIEKLRLMRIERLEQTRPYEKKE